MALAPTQPARGRTLRVLLWRSPTARGRAAVTDGLLFSSDSDSGWPGVGAGRGAPAAEGGPLPLGQVAAQHAQPETKGVFSDLNTTALRSALAKYDMWVSRSPICHHANQAEVERPSPRAPTDSYRQRVLCWTDTLPRHAARLVLAHQH